MRKLIVLVVLAFSTLGAGCAPTLSFISYEPGMIEPRGARRFVIVDGEGKVRAREHVADILADELHGGWFKVKDRSDERIKLVLTDKRATLVPDDARGIGEDDMWLRADVVDWRIGAGVDQSTTQDGKTVLTPVVRAEVVLQLSIADDDGRLLMREQEFAGAAEAPVGPALLERDLLEQAARQAVRQFVANVEPRRLSWKLQLDDSDDGQKVIIAGAKDGAIATARKALERYVKRAPNNAAAHYNLAVLLDAQGASRKALDHYDAAIELGAQDFYFAAREGCSRRAAALDALYGAPPPKKKRAPRDDDEEDGDKARDKDRDKDRDRARDKDRDNDAAPPGAAPPVP
jgi:tetratricopeptide (TPR) repeat protein